MEGLEACLQASMPPHRSLRESDAGGFESPRSVPQFSGLAPPEYHSNPFPVREQSSYLMSLFYPVPHLIEI